ncbi:acyl-CoA dehydrogenase family protein [bacterium]|nr:acyl-CoA dehydrogenase family protein [bacterium]
MDSFYSSEHRIFQQSVRRFCAQEILPQLTSWEEQKHFPDELFSKLGEQGFLGVLVAEEYGGVGGDYILASAWCEEFGRVPAVGLTTGVHMHSVVVSAALNRLGSNQAKEQFLADAVLGKAIGAYAFTEPGAGSDLSSIITTAKKDGDYFIINGAKTFITNGARADFILLLTKTEPDRGFKGFTTFVVDTTLAGFNVNRKLDKLGWHSSDTAELSFQDMRVHKSMILGEYNRGWYHAMDSLNWERLMLVLNSIGGATQCLESTVPYINDRKVFGRPVAAFDHTRELIATLWSKLQAARAVAYQAVNEVQAGKDPRLLTSLAKIYACELAVQIADRCLQLHGGYGYTTEFLPERWLRDLRLNPIGGGTSEVMAMVAAKEMGFDLL